MGRQVVFLERHRTIWCKSKRSRAPGLVLMSEFRLRFIDFEFSLHVTSTQISVRYIDFGGLLIECELAV